jgi:anti-sigma-K factor RskA
MNYNRPDLLDRLAAEYVLGTLRGRARRRFEQVLRQLPAARSAVAAWEDRLAKLATSVPAQAPPKRVWEAIDARTQPRRATAATAAAAAPRRSWLSDWFKPALGFALGAVLTVGIVRFAPDTLVSLEQLAQRQQALPQSYVGLLTDANNVPHVLVSSTRHGTRVTVKSLRPWQVPAGKVAQVWALPRDAQGKDLPPIPLGIAQPAVPPGSTQFDMPASSEALLANVPRLAVSIEDAPAQPGQTPSAFVFSGFCVKLW